MGTFDLTGRRALVTGGARGIGAAIAHGLAKAGASVMIGDIRADLGQETAAAIAKTGVKAGFVELEGADDRQGGKAVLSSVKQKTAYDILINNAGVEITSLIVDIKAEDARRMCDIN